MKQQCSTCRHWRMVYHFDENAYCLAWNTLTIKIDSCHHWEEREPCKPVTKVGQLTNPIGQAEERT